MYSTAFISSFNCNNVLFHFYQLWIQNMRRKQYTACTLYNNKLAGILLVVQTYILSFLEFALDDD